MEVRPETDLQSRQTLDRPPWHFRLAKYAIRNGLRGGYRLIRIANALGGLEVIVRYQLSDRVIFDVPLDRNQWDERDIWDYDPPTIGYLQQVIGKLPGDVTLVDCGADIGIISTLLTALCPNLSKIIALEPNPATCVFLEHNLANLPIPAEARQTAVGREAGMGELLSPLHHPDTDHARYIRLTPDGDIPVTTVDSLNIEPDHAVVVKIDVEGAELDVIEGAIQTLSRSEHFVVDFEAHPEVVRRTGIDPVRVMRRINEVRPCDFRACESPSTVFDLDRGFFDQVADDQVYDVVCTPSVDS